MNMRENDATDFKMKFCHVGIDLFNNEQGHIKIVQF